MNKNVFAYTAPSGSYPPYVSINEVDGGVEVSVRGEPFKNSIGHLQPGEVISCFIPADQWTLK